MLFNNYKYRVVLFGFFDIADVIVDALRIGIAPYGAKMCGMGFSTNIRPRWGHFKSQNIIIPTLNLITNLL